MGHRQGFGFAQERLTSRPATAMYAVCFGCSLFVTNVFAIENVFMSAENDHGENGEHPLVRRRSNSSGRTCADTAALASSTDPPSDAKRGDGRDAIPPQERRSNPRHRRD